MNSEATLSFGDVAPEPEPAEIKLNPAEFLIGIGAVILLVAFILGRMRRKKPPDDDEILPLT